jgi:two-component system, chemotaxis family, CheB/CheR fusion protein
MAEAESSVDLDDRSSGHLIVGLGASAGGLEALEQFFDELPPDPQMSFVVVTHQAPGKVSLLPSLMARHSKMPVVEVKDPVPLEPSRVYVQPPGAILGVLKRELYPMEPNGDGARPFPIDFFFRSLAQDQRDRAVGIVLSGTGSDGTNGLKEIRAVSGLVMAQSEETARYPGMPHSASLALQLDYVLSPREMARQLLAYRDGTAHAIGPVEEKGESRDVMRRLFVLLRSRTGHDFSNYKATTIGRRIARRMGVHQISSVDEYLRFAQANPRELDQLFKELLIGVTSFFRDTEAFEALSAAIPAVLASKPDDHVVRAWVTGCSTGEEAFSLAMLLREHFEGANRHNAVQIFATDLDAEAVEFARAGVFPESIASDVSPSRLERFFTAEEGCYRVNKDLREMVVFAVQDLIEDPAFTKLDFVLCRNLLIYLNSEIQKRVIPLFHYALRPGGVLMLGSSETVGTFSHLFETLNKKWKLFRRKEVPVGTYVSNVALGQAMDASLREVRAGMVTARRIEPGAQIAERAILQHLVPPSVIMHESGEIVHIQGRTGLYLEPASGSQAGANVYGMAREGLQLELALAVRRAAASAEEVFHKNARVKTNGDFTRVNLRVKRLVQPEQLRGLYLVAFEQAESDGSAAESSQLEGSESTRIADLERELSQSKEFHQGTVEELETTNEELKSANEELQSLNEELQSGNEELETSKEEMQSLNEELQTVNMELQDKLEELSRINDDMKNLLNANDIGTIFLDNDLNIKRHTTEAKRIIRVIPSDVGRPVGDLVSNLRYTTLVDDAREVLRTLAFKEAEVQAEDGSWYLMRIMPYRTAQNLIDGLVLTFVDVTKARKLQEQTERLFGALIRSPVGVFAQDNRLQYEWVYGSVFGHLPGDAQGRTDRELLGGQDGELVMAMKREVLERGERARRKILLGNGNGGKTYNLYVEPVSGDGSGIVGVVTEVTGADDE